MDAQGQRSGGPPYSARGAAATPGLAEVVLFVLAALFLGLAGRSWFAEQIFRHREGARLDRVIAQTTSGGTSSSVETEAIARLEIPRLGLSQLVVDGADKADLDRAVGRIPWGAAFGGKGTVGLAGHRDRQFRKLRNIELGDTLRVTTLRARYTYVVESTRVVTPDSVEVLAPVGYPKLTLITCYPFSFIGPAPRRFVVDARLVPSASSTSG